MRESKIFHNVLFMYRAVLIIITVVCWSIYSHMFIYLISYLISLYISYHYISYHYISHIIIYLISLYIISLYISYHYISYIIIYLISLYISYHYTSHICSILLRCVICKSSSQYKETVSNHHPHIAT